MFTRWLPWKMIIKQAARKHGFLDPLDLMARLHQFAQPSEVAEPIELLRAGMVFHARGLINTKAIQHNLDWVWPYWVERQFNPEDPSFIPRAFSITHTNMTHRNWTAVGIPGYKAYPIVDPRGLVTPFYDGWSLDAWIIDSDGNWLFPSKQPDAQQTLYLDNGLEMETILDLPDCQLKSRSEVLMDHGVPVSRTTFSATCNHDGHLVVSLRPYNPEGISFIHQLAIDPVAARWVVNNDGTVAFSDPWDSFQASDYRSGDVRLKLPSHNPDLSYIDDVGMLTAGALYAIDPNTERSVTVDIDLSNDPEVKNDELDTQHVTAWPDSLNGTATLELPDAQYNFLYDAAVRNLILHSPKDTYPGPYTYRRFWFRDAAFLTSAMMAIGLHDRVKRQIEEFLPRQTAKGYFKSQEGEWDSNGEAIWAMARYLKLTNTPAPDDWLKAIRKGARWIQHKRLSEPGEWHDGLLPAGFSAEHLGTNDYYYWDDYWSVAGLEAAAAICKEAGAETDQKTFSNEARDLMQTIDNSLEKSRELRDHQGIPASPHRRMDAGAIGSLACGYPLSLVDPKDSRLMGTIDFLLENCMCKGGFFQDMIHSGINPYLTLHMAQVLLRAGDSRHAGLIKAVADMASPTGQWPEAVHPLTMGGCMGDGQHMWAAAEWVLMMRSLFVLEGDETLTLCAGLSEIWLEPGNTLRFGPTSTPFGTVDIDVNCSPEAIILELTAEWHDTPPKVEVNLPWMDSPQTIDPGQSRIELARPKP